MKLKFYKDPSVARRVLFSLYGKSGYIMPGLVAGGLLDSLYALPITYGIMGLLMLDGRAREWLRKGNKLFDQAYKKNKISEFVSKQLRAVFVNGGLVQKEIEERRDSEGNIKKIEVIRYPEVEIKADDNNYYLVIKMLPGQTSKQWEGRQDAFAHALASDLVSFEVRRGVVELTLQHTDMKSDCVLYKEDREERYVNVGYAPGRILTWDFDKSPHMLVVGVTGSGKSTFIRNLLVQIGKTWDLKIVDGKMVEFSFLKRMGYDVYTSKEELLRVMEEAEEEMDRRYRLMDEEGVNEYHQVGLKPYFILVDEFITLVESMRNKPRKGGKVQGIQGEDKSEKDRLFEFLYKLSTKGRAAGIQLVLILQRPDSTFLPTAVRDNLTAKVVLRGSETALEMAFGGEYKRLAQLPRGQGYCSIDGEPVVFAYVNYGLDEFRADMGLEDSNVVYLEKEREEEAVGER